MAQAEEENPSGPDLSWAIYWYLCGSDLESEGGGATADLQEMLAATLPDDVAVIIQTGGAKEWQNEAVDPEKAQRFLFHKGDLVLIDTIEKANMGEAETLRSFLEFCQKNYPAKRQMFLCWNHGGGSVSGIAFDEQFDDDSLTLPELENAFSSLYEKNEQHPPFEVVGFDACLMATLDTSRIFHGFSSVMVASQDLEPGNGWEYTGWLTQLGKKTDMNGAELGKIICDTYLEGCRSVSTENSATLSVVDINKAQVLWHSMDLFGFDALSQVAQNKRFFSSFSRHVKKAENYRNSAEEGYTNMVDLGQLLQQTRDILPESSELAAAALKEAVLYNVNGPYRKANGLSCFFPFDGKKESYGTMLSMTPSAMLAYYGCQYGFVPSETAGELALACANSAYESLNDMFGENEGENPENALNISKPTAIGENIKTPSSNITSLEDFKLTLTDDGDAQLTLGPDRVSMLDKISFLVAIVDAKEKVLVLLGSDADITSDWDSGIFKGHFSGAWPALDSHSISLEITEQNEDFNLYVSPILLNGIRYNLEIAYDFKKEAYSILGARRQIDAKGKSDKKLIQLKKGDKITTLMWAMSLDDEKEDSELAEFKVDTFTIQNEPVIRDEDMGDGQFAFIFNMEDIQKQSAMSEVVFFTSNGDQITIQKELEEEEHENN